MLNTQKQIIADIRLNYPSFLRLLLLLFLLSFFFTVIQCNLSSSNTTVYHPVRQVVLKIFNFSAGNKDGDNNALICFFCFVFLFPEALVKYNNRRIIRLSPSIG